MVLCKCCQGYATLCRVFTLLMMIAGVVLSVLAAGSCEFVTRDGQEGQVTFGLFRFSPPGEDLGWNDCLTYSDQSGFTYSWLHKWAAVSSALAMCLGALLVLLMLIDCCCNVCCSKFMQTFLVVCCQLNQGFTFLIWLSNACFFTRKNTTGDNWINRGCRIGNGSTYSFCAFMLFFIGGFFLFCSPKPDPLCCQGSKDKDKKDEENAKEKAAADEKPGANEEEKPNEEDTTVVAAAAVVNEEKEEEKKKVEEAKSETNEEAKDEEQPDEPAQSTVEAVPVPVPVPVEEKVDDNPDDEPIVPDTPVEDEEPEEPPTKDVEAPAVVPILPNEPERGLTPPPEDLSMEIEYDDEFGTSINRGWAE